MKRFFYIFIILASVIACSKKGDDVWQEKPVAKKVEFHVHAGHDYSAPIYSTVSAEVTMHIYKINFHTGRTQLLWDTTYAGRSLVQYPHLPQKFLVEKQFPVLESQEKLQAKYTVMYQSAQGVSQQVFAEELVPGKDFAFLDVNV